MKAWVRRKVDELCQHANASFTDIEVGGPPTDEFFGATGDPGVSTVAAASDHLHGMPSIEDILEDSAFFFDDAMLTAPANVFSLAGNNTTGSGALDPTFGIGGHDDVGALGDFGSFQIRTGNGVTGSCGAMVQNQATPSATAQIHLWQRVEELAIRMAPGSTGTNTGLANINQILCAVGGMRSSSGFGTVTTPVASITDGVYFLLTTDASGLGNWFATTMNNGVSTSVDTGVGAVISGTDVGYQNFKINYDHATTTATFTIDDVQVAEIATNIPPSTRKLAGFGYWVQTITTGAARQVTSSMGRLLYVGARVAS